MDKNKIIEAAGKLVAKGAYDKAIKEYQRVLEVDPKDVRVLQKMGELFQKKNDNIQAAVYFTKVAESYANDGFFLKAVALYKQVLKLDPSLMDVNIRLAELHQQLQLLGEAMAYYQIVANHWDKAGDARRSLDTLKKMVELDPENVASRVKLADLYVRQQMNDEAAAEFQKAAEHLKRNNRIDDYLRVAERLSALDPNNLTLARELAELYIQRNDQKRALAKLQVCFKADPRDIDTLRLLAVAFQGLGQTSKTVSVYKELARAYDEKGRTADSDQVWQQLERLDPNDPDLLQRKAALEPAPAPVAAPPPPPATRGSGVQPAPVSRGSGVMAPPASRGSGIVAAPPPPTAAPPKTNIGKLLTETDVYVKYGLHDKALEHLRKVFAVEPENIDAHEKAYQIYVASNQQAQAFEQLLNVLRLHTRTGDATRAQPYLATMLQTDPGHAEVPAFLAALRIEGATMPTAAESDGAEDAILVDSSDDEVIVADDESEEVVSGEVSAPVESSPASSMMLSPDDAEAAGRYDIEKPPVADAYLPPEEEEEAVISEEEEEEPSTDSTGISVRSVAGQDEFADTPTSDGDVEAYEPPTDSTRVVSLEQLEAMNASPAARPSAPVPEPEESFATAMNDVDAAQEASPAADYEEAVEPPPEEALVDAPPETQQTPPPQEEEPASEECDEALFFIEQGLFDEAREILETVMIAYPDHQRAAQLMAQIEAGGAAPVAEEPSTAASGDEENKDAFDLAHELAEELGDFGGGAPAPAPQGDDYQVSVDEVFSEFKKGLEKVVKPEDVDTHYDLGIAYKEMGLVDDAIGEFQVARKGCIGKRKEIDCLTMMGMLATSKGDAPGAIDAFMQALTSEHASGDVEKALRYELAQSYEAAGQDGKALAQFMKVQALDAGYRDVASKVGDLSARTAPEEDAPKVPPKGGGGPKGGAPAGRKVGFI